MYGQFQLRLDEKGRLILPAKERVEWAAGLYLTWGWDNCLYLFSEDQFPAFVADMRSREYPGIPTAARDRMFFASVKRQEMDKQGRITLSPENRQYADIDRDVVVFGLPERTEIWDAGAWQRYQDQYMNPFAASASDHQGAIPTA